jgi:hypothetical protein
MKVIAMSSGRIRSLMNFLTSALLVSSFILAQATAAMANDSATKGI